MLLHNPFYSKGKLRWLLKMAIEIVDVTDVPLKDGDVPWLSWPTGKHAIPIVHQLGSLNPRPNDEPPMAFLTRKILRTPGDERWRVIPQIAITPYPWYN